MPSSSPDVRRRVAGACAYFQGIHETRAVRGAVFDYHVVLGKGVSAGLDIDDPRLRFTLKVDGGPPRLRYQPSADTAPEEIVASKARDRVMQILDPSFTRLRARAVNDAFSTDPGGKPLGELAAELNLWA